ncbi:MAG TPA: hypothetical protein VNA25_30335 [Phycisphaerae bacterium]|nr:hypothetical protein [Phycisphaerae bacterium]
MTESAERTLIEAVKAHNFFSRPGQECPLCLRILEAIAAAEAELEGERVIRAICEFHIDANYESHNMVKGSRITFAPGRYAIRKIAPEPEKVRPFVWRRPSGSALYLCPSCHWDGRCHPCDPLPRVCPQCKVVWAEPRELPA